MNKHSCGPSRDSFYSNDRNKLALIDFLIQCEVAESDIMLRESTEVANVSKNRMIVLEGD